MTRQNLCYIQAFAAVILAFWCPSVILFMVCVVTGVALFR